MLHLFLDDRLLALNHFANLSSIFSIINTETLRFCSLPPLNRPMPSCSLDATVGLITSMVSIWFCTTVSTIVLKTCTTNKPPLFFAVHLEAPHPKVTQELGHFGLLLDENHKGHTATTRQIPFPHWTTLSLQGTGLGHLDGPLFDLNLGHLAQTLGDAQTKWIQHFVHSIGRECFCL